MQDNSTIFVVINQPTTRRLEAPRAASLYGTVGRLARWVRSGTSLVGVIAFIIYVTVAGLTVSIGISSRNAHREAKATQAAAEARSTEAPLTEPTTEPMLLDGR